MSFDVDAIRAQFPILQRELTLVDGRKVPLTYFDHGASTHAPLPVIEAVNDLMMNKYANIHRGNHTLSLESSDLFDDVQETIAAFVGTDTERSAVIFTQNTTMALDIVAHTMSFTPGATLTTLMEHHSNDLPHRSRGEVLHADVDEFGRVLYEDVQEKLDQGGVKLLAVTGASNVTGYMPDIARLARMAHAAGAKILVDAAQLYAHAAIDVKPAEHPEHIDFLAIAGHKAYSPYGGAALIADRDVMDAVPPYMAGGGTVRWVTADNALWTTGPDRHMGGTPNIPGAIALGAATKFLADVGMDNVRQHEVELIDYALKRFAEFDDIVLFGPQESKQKGAVFSFVPGNASHAAFSTALDRHYGIATRNGCFCAHPLLHKLLKLGDTTQWTDALNRGESIELPGAVRAAVGIYNTQGELDLLFGALDDLMSGKTKIGSEVMTSEATEVS